MEFLVKKRGGVRFEEFLLGKVRKFSSPTRWGLGGAGGLEGRDGRAGLFCHRAGLEQAGLTFVKPGWAGAGIRNIVV